MYRNDWDAAVARATALEEELRRAQAGQATDAATIAQLSQQLAATQAELARLRGGAFAPGPFGYRPPARGALVLTLGILSLVMCGFLGPVAWSMGSSDLAAIDRGELDPGGRGMLQAGRVCGIIASALLVVALVSVLMLVGLFRSIAG